MKAKRRNQERHREEPQATWRSRAAKEIDCDFGSRRKRPRSEPCRAASQQPNAGE
ncbi:MAG: hypothetical protein ABTQ34_08185 [Bdellovibrionales bacterium]